MAGRSLQDVIRAHRGEILRELHLRLDRLPPSAYQEFSQSDEGRARMEVWLDKVLAALDGEPEVFFSDIRAVGYQRARQGFELDFVARYHAAFLRIAHDVAQRESDGGVVPTAEHHRLAELFLEGLHHVTASYLRTREELNAVLLAQVERARRELQLLTVEAIAIQEEERRRVAGDIHDTITQSLTAVGYKLQVCSEAAASGGDPAAVAAQVDNVLDMVHGALRQSRAIISGLRPDLIDTLGLVPALRQHIESFERDTGMRVEALLPDAIELSTDRNICLFRAVQEAMMNSYKHAGVDRVEVALERCDGSVRVAVVDRGRGFDPERPDLHGRPGSRRLGLLMLRERARSLGGDLQLTTAPGRGCRVLVSIPVEVRS